MQEHCLNDLLPNSTLVNIHASYKIEIKLWNRPVQPIEKKVKRRLMIYSWPGVRNGSTSALAALKKTTYINGLESMSSIGKSCKQYISKLC